MLHIMLDFPENEEDSRKFKKLEEWLQHFSEQCRHYVQKQNISYKHWWKFGINYEEDRENGRRKTEANAGNNIIYTKNTYGWVCMFLILLSVINGYIATFCDLKKKTKKLFIF